MLSAQTNEKLTKDLQKKGFSLSEETLQKLFSIQLAEGYGHVSLKAIDAFMPYLQKGLKYDKACEAIGVHHSQNEEEFEPQFPLPYYGEVLQKHVMPPSKDKVTDLNNPEQKFGKIHNPTVHMALNQLRLVLNELKKTYGHPPREIYIELARDTAMSIDDLKKYNKRVGENKKANDKINDQLEAIGVRPNYDNRMKYKLWEDLAKNLCERCCPLCEKTDHAISRDDLFFGAYEVEHIIPFSKCYDNSRNNKMISCKSCNHEKGNRTPFEAFGHTDKWQNILEKAKKMPRTKQWRFQEDAMARIEDDQFIARQLNDTKYVSRMALRYAEMATGKYEGERRVFAVKGKFTSDLRHHWGLSRFVGDFKDGKFVKDRTNHHHHAIDAIVVGLSSSKFIERVAAANKMPRKDEGGIPQLDIPEPFAGFRKKDIKKIEARLKTLVISHKLDHKNPEKARRSGTSIGQLHEDTNYGHVCKNLYATRKPLSVDNFASQKHIGEIASPNIREAVGDIFARYADIKGKLKSAYKKDYFDALESYKSSNNIKKVRIHLHKDNLIPIHDRAGKAYRHVIGGNNFCAEIWVNDKGKKAGKWQCEVIRNFDINQKGFMPRWRTENPTAMKVMRLQINDMVAIDRNGKRVICRVQKMAMSGQIILRYHNDSTTEKKTEISVAGSSLQKQNARKIFVSPTGKIYDPGHAKRPKWNK